MADVTKVQASDGTIYTINDEDDYTKAEIDAMLADKADVGVSYTKAEEDALLAQKPSNTEFLEGLALKANKDETYTKTEVDGLLDGKANVGISYTKADTADVDDALLLKADKVDTYTKSETDTLLADKADVGDSYTKAEDDALLADKADVGDSYTKAEDNALLADKVDKEYTELLNMSGQGHVFSDFYSAAKAIWDGLTDDEKLRLVIEFDGIIFRMNYNQPSNGSYVGFYEPPYSGSAFMEIRYILFRSDYNGIIYRMYSAGTFTRSVLSASDGFTSARLLLS